MSNSENPLDPVDLVEAADPEPVDPAPGDDPPATTDSGNGEEPPPPQPD